MSGRGKRLWAPQLNFDEAYQETLNYLKRCQEHHVLSAPTRPELFYAYKLQQPVPTAHFHPLSPLLKFGYESQPLEDDTKAVMAKLLSVALKLHYFNHTTLSTAHEPYWFAIPDLSQPHRQQYGLIYTLHQAGQIHCWLITTWDLSQSASQHKRFDIASKFPTVLPKDLFQWLSIKRWKALKEQQVPLNVHHETEAAHYQAGHVLDYPAEFNPEFKALGAVWARGIKRWVFPKGWDIQAVHEYLQWFSQLTPQARFEHRWTKTMEYPKLASPYGNHIKSPEQESDLNH